MSGKGPIIALSVVLLVLLILQVVGFGSPSWVYASYSTYSLHIGLFQFCLNAFCFTFFQHVGINVSYIILLILQLVGCILLLSATIIAFVSMCREGGIRMTLQKILALSFSAAAVILAAVIWYAVQFYINFSDAFGAISSSFFGVSLGYSFYCCALSGAGSLILGIVACILFQRAPDDSPGTVITSEGTQMTPVAQPYVQQPYVQQPMYPQGYASPQYQAQQGYGYPQKF